MSCMRYPRDATLIPLPSDVVRVLIPKGEGFEYKGGQYVFIAVPELSMFEWHPFSLSSAPHQGDISLHVRVLGGWTRRLRDLSLKGGGAGLRVRVLLDGPYGAPGVDLDSDRYKCVLCVSGGIGITPLQSVTNDLIAQHRAGRPLRHIYFVWSVRDKFMLDAMHRGLTPETSPGDGAGLRTRLPLSFQPDLLDRHELQFGNHLGDHSPRGQRADAERPLINKDPTQSGLLHTEFYLTKVRDHKDFDSAGISPDVQPCLRFGRPSLPAVFGRMQAVAHGA
eukprot:gene8015-17145_t